MQPISELKCCGDCKRFLNLVDFAYKYPQLGIVQSYCRQCQRRRSREHYVRNKAAYKVRIARNNQRVREANRERLHTYLSSRQCLDCGISDLAVLEFDHRGPALKLNHVSHMVQKGFGWATILSEIAKCDVVCANCHRRRTARQF